MTWRITHALAALSFLACLFVATLWLRTAWVHDWITFTTPGRRLWILRTQPLDGNGTLRLATIGHWPVNEPLQWRTFDANYQGYQMNPVGAASPRTIHWAGATWQTMTSTTEMVDGKPLLYDVLSSGGRSPTTRGTITTSPPMSYASVVLPYWLPLAVTALLPALVTGGHVAGWLRRRYRRQAARCATCGYDLRATPDRCPECGTIAAAAPAPIPGRRVIWISLAATLTFATIAFAAWCRPSVPWPQARARAGAPPAPLSLAEQVPFMKKMFDAKEGPGKRGYYFNGLVSALDDERRKGKVFTEPEVIDRLGPPDRAARRGDRAELIYYYNGRGTKDHVAYVSLSPMKTEVGYNSAWVNAAVDATIPPYVPLGQATTQPTHP